jgi:glyceraldehyde 3-phosphate dehydrogenase
MGISGFGRIGRLVLRAAFADKENKYKILAINDHSKDVDYLMYLLKYDSVHGPFEGKIEKSDGGMKVNGHFIKIFKETDASKISWGSAGAEYICDSTG